MPRCNALTPQECPAFSTDLGTAEATGTRTVAAVSPRTVCATRRLRGTRDASACYVVVHAMSWFGPTLFLDAGGLCSTWVREAERLSHGIEK